MRKREILSLIILITTVFIGCSKDSEGNDVLSNYQYSYDLSEEQIIVIDKIVDVNRQVADFLQNVEDIKDMDYYLDQLSSIDGVEKAWIEDNNELCVKINKGGIVSWAIRTEDVYSTSDNSYMINQNAKPITRSTTGNSGVCKNKQICVINQTSYDSHLNYVNEWLDEYVSDIKNSENGNIFQIRKVNANDFTLDFVKDSLSRYGTIILVAHGAYGKGGPGNEEVLHWIGTRDSKFDDEKFKYWKDGYLKIAYECDTINKGLAPATIGCFFFSEKYLDYVLPSNFFQENSIMYNTSCHSLEDSRTMWDVLKSKGLGCYLGYYNTVRCNFALSGIDMFFYLLIEKGLYSNDAYRMLESSDRIRDPKNKHANLVYCSTVDICYYGIQLCPDENHPHMIDIGLPSGTKWACCNLGASKPEDYGDYYAWGETETKDFYNMWNYMYYEWSWNNTYTSQFLINDNISGKSEYDAATKMGEGWRLPTNLEYEELFENSIIKGGDFHGVNGCFFTSTKTGNTIFLPAAEEGREDEVSYNISENSHGFYWTGTILSEEYQADVFYIKIGSSGSAYIDDARPYRGFTIRAVH